jgi:hypothetical protein
VDSHAVHGTGNSFVIAVVLVYRFMQSPGAKDQRSFSAFIVLHATEKNPLHSGHGVTTTGYGVKNVSLIIQL